MSDSGRTAGDCDHGKTSEFCIMCLRAKCDKLQAFKDWVHAYLDQHDVPHHPPGSHGAAGCRIGDRMDWLMAHLKEQS